MNFDFLKFKLPKFGFKKVLGAEVGKLWNGFLWSLIIFALIVFSFDAWIFWHFSKAKNEEVAPETRILRTRNLTKALERLDAKKTKLENYQKGFIIEDPS